MFAAAILYLWHYIWYIVPKASVHAIADKVSCISEVENDKLGSNGSKQLKLKNRFSNSRRNLRHKKISKLVKRAAKKKKNKS